MANDSELGSILLFVAVLGGASLSQDQGGRGAWRLSWYRGPAKPTTKHIGIRKLVIREQAAPPRPNGARAVALSLVRRYDASGEMRIAFGEASVGDELVWYFRLNDCVVEYVGRNTVAVGATSGARERSGATRAGRPPAGWCKLHAEAIVSLATPEPIVTESSSR